MKEMLKKIRRIKKNGYCVLSPRLSQLMKDHSLRLAEEKCTAEKSFPPNAPERLQKHDKQ